MMRAAVACTLFGLALTGCSGGTEDPVAPGEDADGTDLPDTFNDIGTDGTDDTGATDGTDATDFEDVPEVTDPPDPGGTDGTDDTDMTGDTDGTDETDTTDPPVCEACDLPYELCDWCPLLEEPCNVAQTGSCIDAAASIGGLPSQYPSCMEPACNAQTGHCTIREIPRCCTSVEQCPQAGAGGCFQVSCFEELQSAVPPHLTTVSYCDIEVLKDDSNCACEDGATDITKLEQEFTSFPSIPVGWNVTDTNPNDNVSWQPFASGEAITDCKSGENCLYLGYYDEPSGTRCRTYYNGTVDHDTCEPAANCPGGCQDPSAVNLRLTSPQLALTPANLPWALTFWLKMDTEKPFSQGGFDFSGDVLRLVVLSGGEETVVFDSQRIDNVTPGDAFELISVDLNAWAGETIQLQWRFNTANGQGNELPGIILDDARVGTICDGDSCSTIGAPCDDDDVCTEDRCGLFEPTSALTIDPPSGFCVNVPIPGCQACTEDTDCNDPPGDPAQFSATCAGGICEYLSTQCPASPEPLESFEGTSLPAGWEAVNDGFCDNAWTTVDVAGGGRSTEGISSIYFGQPKRSCDIDEVPACPGGAAGMCPTYDCEGTPTSGELLSPAYQIPSGTVYLTFDLLLSTEIDVYPEFDPSICDDLGICPERLLLYAEPAGGSPVVVWDSYDVGGTTACEFQSMTANVSAFSGQAVRFRFEFVTGDGQVNDFEGVYIDNFKVRPLCSFGSGIDCTVDDHCEELEVDACTVATCVEAQCFPSPVEGCCTNSTECTDNIVCTVESCDTETNTCVSTLTGDANCCDTGDPTYWVEDFDGEALPEGWSVTTAEELPESVAWQWQADGGAATDDGAATGGIYFGDPATGTYAAGNDRVAGSLVSPVVRLPAGGTPTVTFDLRLSTEFEEMSADDFAAYLEGIDTFFFDRLAVYVAGNGGQGEWELAWRSEDGAPLRGATLTEPDPENPEMALQVTWRDVGFSVAPWAGEEVRLRFEFDSLQGQENEFGGVNLDNVRISQVCPLVVQNPCIADAWCLDDHWCTIDSCGSGGQCFSEDDEDNLECCFPEPVSTYGFDSGGLSGWTISPTQDSVRWHSSTLLARSGAGSLRFGRVGGPDYSSCNCASDEACEGSACLPAQCITESGQSAPAGTATSPAFQAAKGEDYEISFSLRPELNLSEGSAGFVEAFTVKLVTEGPSTDEIVATLVCHAGECDVLGDACASGINFEYPTCGNEQNPGDYGAWRDYSFNLSEVLCQSAAAGNGAAGTLIETIADPDESATFKLLLSMEVSDNSGNCGQGLFIDEITQSRLCNGWNATCQ